MRATSESSDGQKVSVFTCVPACTVYQAGFVDTIKLALGASGHVQGVEETTAVRTCKPGKVTKAQSFKTTVVIRRPSKGPQCV